MLPATPPAPQQNPSSPYETAFRAGHHPPDKLRPRPGRGLNSPAIRDNGALSPINGDRPGGTALRAGPDSRVLSLITVMIEEESRRSAGVAAGLFLGSDGPLRIPTGHR